ncbi:1-deoxy-11-beta-hydroxypentalenate dehydrogenase [Labrenzia sp. THAF82]|uniref:SDR family NAD(P)-dependent oxidoreductase n=1 Tax=Labrenzia sp. THAF82 TaxID=2587861 RepID=UPI001268BEF5|nr:SDR family NAD(P)-dependent oxidoreductase [Labrenzia sp. THAF82]QFT33631.1 1-deoxy-11-beta-hydroxypentalenate dehydrogenase [Labrenzia sp. THAF82]
MTHHPAFARDKVALITGGAAGIGFALAKRFAEMGLKLVLVDNRADTLRSAVTALTRTEVMTAVVDVSDRVALQELREQVNARFGGIDVLVNNAGIEPSSDALGPLDKWQNVMGVNLWGIIHGCQVFVPDMIARARPGLVINTGSKQGITAPPGNPAYNVSKAALKTYTEALEHQLRNVNGPRINAHLLIPGFVFTELTAGDRAEKPAGAWTPDQTAAFALQSVKRGDFYILCPDNDVDRELDEKRMVWAMGDIIENRPPLSRWHEDWTAVYDAYIAQGDMPRSPDR